MSVFKKKNQTKNRSKTSIAYIETSKEALPSGDNPIPLGSGIIKGIIGEGGMARVYRIWNENLDIYRAVKIPLPPIGENLRERLISEARIAAKLNHPNIIQVHDMGEFNSIPYIEMEYIDGKPLREILRPGGLPFEVCWAISVLMVKALFYLHTYEYTLEGKKYEGIIHRDIKPENIMITKSGIVKLMDFGIARPEQVSIHHTQVGVVVGTQSYLAPEQVYFPDKIDARVDIFAFGAVLFEMTTGIKKSENPNPIIQSQPELLDIAEKCLKLNKEERYKNSGELMLDLDKISTKNSLSQPGAVLKKYQENIKYLKPVQNDITQTYLPKDIKPLEKPPDKNPESYARGKTPDSPPPNWKLYLIVVFIVVCIIGSIVFIRFNVPKIINFGKIILKENTETENKGLAPEEKVPSVISVKDPIDTLEKQYYDSVYTIAAARTRDFLKKPDKDLASLVIQSWNEIKKDSKNIQRVKKAETIIDSVNRWIKNESLYDSLYEAAKSSQNEFNKNPGAATCEKAKKVWNMIKKIHSQTHPRYKYATKQITLLDSFIDKEDKHKSLYKDALEATREYNEKLNQNSYDNATDFWISIVRMYSENKEHKHYIEANLKLQSIKKQFTYLVSLHTHAKKMTDTFYNNKTQSTYENAVDAWIALIKNYPSNKHKRAKEAEKKIEELKNVFFTRK